MAELIVEGTLCERSVARILVKELAALPWVSKSKTEDGVVPSEIWIPVEGKAVGYLLSLHIETIDTDERHFKPVRVASSIAGLSTDRVFYTEEEVREHFHDHILPKLIRAYYKVLARSLCWLFGEGVKERVTKDLLWSTTRLRSIRDEVGMVLTIDKDSIEFRYKEAEEGELPRFEIHYANEGHAFTADVLPDQIDWIENLMAFTIAKYCN